MQPTPRALALEAPIRAALRQIEQSLGDGEGFDPGRSRQRFTVAVTDYVELICMPALMRRLSERAPGISIAIQHLTPTLPAEALDKGELDLVLGRFENVPRASSAAIGPARPCNWSPGVSTCCWRRLPTWPPSWSCSTCGCTAGRPRG